MDEFISNIRAKYHNRKWWTARLMDQASEQAKIDKDTLAKIIAGAVGVVCAVTKQARVCCNSILIAMPLIFTFGYPEESASRDDMVIYWSLFGILTICDKSLEKIPLYYDLKLLLALLLFVEPFRLIDKIRELLQGKTKQESRIFNEKEMDTLRKSTGSPRPEKPPRSDGIEESKSPVRKTDETAEASGLLAAQKGTAAAEAIGAKSQELREGKLEGSDRDFAQAGTAVAEPTAARAQEVIGSEIGSLQGSLRDTANAEAATAQPAATGATVVREGKAGEAEKALSEDIRKASTFGVNATAAEHEEVKNGRVTSEKGTIRDVTAASSALAGTMAIEHEVVKDAEISGERKSTREIRHPKTATATPIVSEDDENGNGKNGKANGQGKRGNNGKPENNKDMQSG
ncbi:hypothetical protein V3C99_007835 [Haemonchus contortus]